MRFFRPFLITRWLFPGALTRIRTGDKMVCLTFDDGPDPESTPHLLSILRLHGVRATFFCSGQAAEKYPELMDEIRSEGHVVGNHGYSHIDGWCSSGEKYRKDVERAVSLTSDRLFRPPYGHLTPCQFRILSQKFSIILWDIMPYDFDKGISYAESLNILKSKIRKGSIVVLHDRPDSSAHKFLDQFIRWTFESGYRFIPVPETIPFRAKT